MKEAVLEALELLEQEGRKMNKEQRKYIHENYHAYLRFQYAEGHLCYAFETSEENFKMMEHYLGLEYEKDSIELLIKYNSKVVVVYGLNDRLISIMAALEKLEEKMLS